MRAVKSRNNLSTELKLIEIFKNFGIKGWRRRYKIFGNPDFCFPNARIAVFADGCFWHGHGCRKHKPLANAEYWTEKVARNKKRDRIVSETLAQKGWIVFRIWECELKKGVSLRKLKTISKSISDRTQSKSRDGKGRQS